MKTMFSTTALCVAAMSTATAATANEVIFVSLGGAYQEAQTKAILDPVSELTGLTIRQDSTYDPWPQVRTQAETGTPIWDVIDTPTKDCIRGGQQGIIEPLDLSVMPSVTAMPEELRNEFSVAYEFYSSVLSYSTEAYDEETAPKTWADFWDVENFPGTRALRNHPLANLEAALMADGVAPADLYPLDVERAFAKLEEIKPHITVWWTSGAQSAQLLADGEVDMTMAWNGRVTAIKNEGAPVDFTYNEGILQYTSLCVLKNAPNRENAMKFIEAAMSPEIQANFPEYIDYGPGNPAAYDTGKISAERAAELPNSPENASLQIITSTEWWASPAGEDALQRWASFVQQ